MDSKVKLKSKGGAILDTTFAHAQKILRIDKNNAFEVAEPDKFQFINNELIKRPSKGGNKKPAKQKRSSKGEQVPE
tara:strand:- start:70 stop:297 length:228 start_codon:yes stop_codon:yes gene_type:complete